MVDQILRNVIYYVEALLRRPLWVILPFLAVLGLGAGVVFNLPRSYQSAAQLLIGAPQTQGSLVPATVAAEHLQFVEQRVLARDKLIALARKLDLFPGLRDEMTETKLAEQIRRLILITTFAAEPTERYSGTTAMHVMFTAPSAEQASAGASELVRLIVEESRGQRIQRATEISAFLEREVSDLSDRLQEREAGWKTFFDTNADLLPARLPGLDGEVSERERELTGLDQSIAALDQELRLLEAELRLGRQRPETDTRDRAQLADLESELAAKSVSLSDAHPDIRSLKRRVESLRQRVASDAGAHASQLSPELALVAERAAIARGRHASLTEKRAEVNARITELRKAIEQVPAVAAQAEAIGRERTTLEAGLNEMRGRLSTARIGERLERDEAATPVQVLEAPETPRYPASPSRTRALLMVAAAALAAGAGGLYLGDTLRRTVRGTFDLKTHLAGSTLVVIPHWTDEGARRGFAGSALMRLARLATGERPAMS